MTNERDTVPAPPVPSTNPTAELYRTIDSFDKRLAKFEKFLARVEAITEDDEAMEETTSIAEENEVLAQLFERICTEVIDFRNEKGAYK